MFSCDGICIPTLNSDHKRQYVIMDWICSYFTGCHFFNSITLCSGFSCRVNHKNQPLLNYFLEINVHLFGAAESLIRVIPLNIYFDV